MLVGRGEKIGGGPLKLAKRRRCAAMVFHPGPIEREREGVMKWFRPWVVETSFGEKEGAGSTEGVELNDKGNEKADDDDDDDDDDRDDRDDGEGHGGETELLTGSEDR